MCKANKPICVKGSSTGLAPIQPNNTKLKIKIQKEILNKGRNRPLLKKLSSKRGKKTNNIIEKIIIKTPKPFEGIERNIA